MKLLSFQKRQIITSLTTVGASMLLLIGIAILKAPNAFAVVDTGGTSTTSTIEVIQGVCQDLKMDKDAKKGCTKDEMKRVRNVASHNCEQGKGNEGYECIIEKATKYLKKAANEDPKTKAKFIDALEDALKDASGDPKKPAAWSTHSLDDECETDGGCDETTDCENGKCLDPAADPNVDCDKHACDLIKKYVNPFVNLLSISFGLIAVASIIIGSIQYTASAGDPQRVTEAKKRIVNTIIAVVAYFFLYGFLQFLIPGGIFNS